MLLIIGAVISSLTVGISGLLVNSLGQIKEGTKLYDVFDTETLEFISEYFGRGGKKREWLENTCLVSFRSRGVDKEMILYSSPGKRSEIKIDDFPFTCKKELDQPWRCVVGQNKKKRPIPTPVAMPAQREKPYVDNPYKKTCLELFISPQGKSSAVSKPIKSTPILKTVQVMIDI